MLKSSVGSIQRRILGAAAALCLLGANDAVAARHCIAPDYHAYGECLYQVFPVVISAPGAHGASFRTSVTMINRTSMVSGRLVFHPAGQNGSDSDPSLSFVLNFSEIRTIPDVVVAIGATGLGSLDVLLSAHDVTSLFGFFIFADLYNDSAEHPATPVEAVFPVVNFSLAPGENILSLYYSGSQPVPDLENRRLRLGVRTLSDNIRSCRMTFQLFDSERRPPVALSEQVLPESYFQQFDPAELFGRPLQAGQLIVVSPSPGDGCPTIAYVAVADNVTNAPSIRLFRGTTYQAGF